MTYKDYDGDITEEETQKPKQKKSKKYSKGFYVVVAVCLVAVGAAAWTTYGSVANYMDEGVAIENSDNSYSSKGEEQAGVPVSGITEETTGTNVEKEKTTSAAQTEHEEQSTEENSEINTEPTEQTEPSVIEQTIAIGDKQVTDKKYMYPAGETVIREFSGETPIYNKTLNDWRTHTGTDFKAEKGSTIKTMDAGVVKDIYNDDLMGVTVAVEHTGGFEAIYCGIQPNDTLEKGQNLSAGDVIGIVSKVPYEGQDESHIHLEVRVDGKTIDPMKLLKRE